MPPRFNSQLGIFASRKIWWPSLTAFPLIVVAFWHFSLLFTSIVVVIVVVTVTVVLFYCSFIVSPFLSVLVIYFSSLCVFFFC